jgi:hypothetical protein
MGKYKQWLHHQEVGARLRDEIAAYEAERERVLKLAPNRAAPLPDLSNPIIAALLGQGLLSQAPVEQITKAAVNDASATTSSTATEKTEAAVAETVAAEAQSITETSATGQQVVKVKQEEVSSSSTTTQTARETAPAAQEEVKTTRAATGKHKTVTTPPARQQEKRAEPAASAAAQPDTIDPLLDALLARAESEPGDPLEALTALASRGPDLTRGEPPAPLPTPTSPASSALSPGETALNALLNQSKGSTNPLTPATTTPLNPPAASASNGQGAAEPASQSSAPARAEKGRVDTDELIAARPAEGYTEPRLTVPWWLRSVELNQEGQEGEKAPAKAEEAEAKQRLSVSLPFENEEDMRLHESVERWWQRWRQQN